MENLTVVIILLAVVTALAEVTDRIKIPFPIMLVLAGIGIGLIPHLPKIAINPDVIFLIFLPPVLYAAAWTTSWPDFKASSRPISLLAIGCVLFTTIMVAVVAHYFIPGFGWPESFVLGAIISPPDAVAAAAATKGLGVPKRVLTILEGESLVNDATGLIAYRYAIAATATGSFIFWLAGINFFYVAIGGIILGLVMGVIFLFIHKITPNNPTTDTTLTFIAPYAAYLLAEHFHISGVLSVVVCGLYISWNSSQIFVHQTRLQANATWNTVIFILNGFIFVLIGLQLPSILAEIKEHSLSTLLYYGLIVSAATIIFRLIWVYPGAYVPRWLFKSIREQEPDTNIGLVTIIGWSGMRGIVSLAAALALPLTVQENIPFPHRSLIIFLTFSVIFSTLVLQGLTLPHMIKWFGIKPGTREQEEEQEARLKIAVSLIEHIEENYALSLSDEALNVIKTKYEVRVDRLQKDRSNAKISDEKLKEMQKILHDLVQKERALLLEMRSNGRVSDEALRRIEYELDLEETRLILDTQTA